MKILVAVDGAPCSRFAAESLTLRPWPPETVFKVVCVLEPYHPELAGWNAGSVAVALEEQKVQVEQAGELVKNTAAYLRTHLHDSADGKLEVEEHISEGHVKETILQLAKDWQADLIVMGSHGRQGMEKLLLGSISQGVLTDAPCSVEIVKRRPVDSTDAQE